MILRSRATFSAPWSVRMRDSSFSEGDVETPVETVLDAPVSANHRARGIDVRCMTAPAVLTLDGGGLGANGSFAFDRD